MGERSNKAVLKAKLDLNYGDERLLLRLVAGLGTSATDAAALVDRIVDFRDSDDLRRPSGAEAVDYRAAGLDYGPANRELLSIDELEQVLHVPTDLVAAIRPFVTVHSRLMGIDPDVADGVLLRTLAKDKGPLRTESSRRRRALWDALALPGELRMHTSGTAYTVAVAAMGRSGDHFVREAVVSIDPDHKYRIASWQRGQGSHVESGASMQSCE